MKITFSVKHIRRLPRMLQVNHCLSPMIKRLNYKYRNTSNERLGKLKRVFGKYRGTKKSGTKNNIGLLNKHKESPLSCSAAMNIKTEKDEL